MKRTESHLTALSEMGFVERIHGTVPGSEGGVGRLDSLGPLSPPFGLKGP